MSTSRTCWHSCASAPAALESCTATCGGRATGWRLRCAALTWMRLHTMLGGMRGSAQVCKRSGAKAPWRWLWPPSPSAWALTKRMCAGASGAA